MKKILLSLTIILVSVIMVSCSKDEPQSGTVLVNVSFDGAIASPSVVKLYKYEDAKDFDKTYTGACHYGSTGDLLDNKDNVITPFAIGDNTLGVNTFKNIPNGKYIIIAFYKPQGYSFETFFYYGYKTIDVNGSLSTHFIEFKNGENALNAKGFVEFK